MPLDRSLFGTRVSKGHVYETWEDLYSAIERGEINPHTEYYDIYQRGLINKKTKEQEAKARYDKYEARQNQEKEIDKREAKQDAADAAINKIFENFPQLADNQPFIDELQKGLEKQGKTLADVYTNIQKEGGTYLDRLAKSVGSSKQELKRSETTAQQGIDKGLDIYRNLAKRTTVPGEQNIRDTISESSASAISDIKKYGGGRGLSALTEVYKNKMAQERELGIQNANYQTQMDLQLAGAETSAGMSMADIIARNAISSTNLSSTLYGAQSDYLNKLSTAKTNIAQQEGNMATTMYGVNTENQMNQFMYGKDGMAKTQAQLGWEQTKYQINDPFSARMQMFGEDMGFAYAEMMRAIQQRNANNKLLTDTLLGGLKLIDPSKVSSFLNFNSNQSGKIIPYDYTLPGNNNQDILPT